MVLVNVFKNDGQFKNFSVLPILDFSTVTSMDWLDVLEYYEFYSY